MIRLIVISASSLFCLVGMAASYIPVWYQMECTRVDEVGLIGLLALFIPTWLLGVAWANAWHRHYRDV